MEVKNLESKELIDLYTKIENFIKFLEKEENDAKKLGE